MNEAERLNDLLRQHAPAAFRALSPLGLDAAMPMGIPAQAAEARSTEINATIGQVTDGHGGALPLPFMRDWIDPLDVETTFLYAPVDGHRTLREKWLTRQVKLGETEFRPSLSVATHGLTHALSILASLFADDDTEVLIPDPYWENYQLLFGLHAGARVRGFPFFRDGGFNAGGLADALDQAADRKVIVVLNLPGNPTGFTPPQEQIDLLLRVLNSHPGPLTVIVDDAYQGTVWEPGCMKRSVFWDLAEKANPERIVAFKVDGATKELFFFPSRLGFLTHSVTGPAADALLSKIRCVIRGTVGCPPGPSQAMALKALDHPDLDAAIAERLDVLKQRYRVLKEALSQSSVLHPFPFNSAYFALVGFEKGVSAENIRRKLIGEQSVGTIHVPSVNAIRIAYCSLDTQQIPELVSRMERALIG